MGNVNVHLSDVARALRGLSTSTIQCWEAAGLLNQAAAIIDGLAQSNASVPRAGPPEGYRSGQWVRRDGNIF
jgi:hypothetical protein